MVTPTQAGVALDLTIRGKMKKVQGHKKYYKGRYWYVKIKLKYRSNKYYSQQRWTYTYYKDKKCRHRIRKIKVQHVNKMVYLRRQ